jgi:hypothetical protein
MSFSDSQSKVIVLTGVPTIGEVGNPKAELLDVLVPAVKRFICGSSDNDLPNPTPSRAWPNWRSLQMENSQSRSQDKKRKQHQPQEHFSFQSIGSAETQEDVSHDFLEHSLVVFEGTTQAELASSTSSDDSTLELKSFPSYFADDCSVASLNITGRATALPSFVSNLKDLPSASSLDKRYPQTITVNLIVGIISIAPARPIQLRRVPRTMELIELIVGDETMAGFSISFWLTQTGVRTDETTNTRHMLERLMSRQVVLLTNVALRVWQGRVYGQSLNRRVSKNDTGIERLDSAQKTATGQPISSRLPVVLQNKLEKVEQWVSHFLSTSDQEPPLLKRESNKLNASLRNVLMEQSELPPDTQ